MAASTILCAGHVLCAGPPPVLVCFGDSITEGFGVRPHESYPVHLEKFLRDRGLSARVINAGVSGDTTATALERLASVVSLKAHVVILEIGGNDGLRGTPVEATRRNIDELIAGLRKGGARVMLVGMTLPANYGAAYLAAFERMYEDLARKHGLALALARNAGVAGVAGMMQPDGIHPTAAGNHRLARYLLPLAERELRLAIEPASPSPRSAPRTSPKDR